jgi:hypothetical protein
LCDNLHFRFQPDSQKRFVLFPTVNATNTEPSALPMSTEQTLLPLFAEVAANVWRVRAVGFAAQNDAANATINN